MHCPQSIVWIKSILIAMFPLYNLTIGKEVKGINMSFSKSVAWKILIKFLSYLVFLGLCKWCTAQW
jgi:hypothetical protein